MTREQALKNAGLAAVIMLAPGGFLLGAALLAKKWRDRRPQGALPTPQEPSPPA